MKKCYEDQNLQGSGHPQCPRHDRSNRSVEVVKDAFGQLSFGKAQSPVWTSLDLHGDVYEVEACLKEAGDLIIPLEKRGMRRSDILAELVEIISGKKTGRRDEREITYFKSVGNAVEDVSVTQAVLHLAEEKGIGQEVDLS